MLASRLHDYSRALVGASGRRVGPFLIGLDEHDPGPFRNYAVPDDDIAPSTGDVTRLVEYFVEHMRSPRLEYLPALCPALEPLLIDAGFRSERRLPVMTCPPSDAAMPTPAGVEVVLASEVHALRAVAEAQNEAYGQAVTTVHDVDRLRSTVERGGLVALARDTATGEGVGGGLCAPPHHGVSELAAIGVRGPYRRRGIAAALAALLTRACPEQGIESPFLTPAGKEEERVYARVGYRRETEMLHISR